MNLQERVTAINASVKGGARPSKRGATPKIRYADTTARLRSGQVVHVKMRHCDSERCSAYNGREK